MVVHLTESSAAVLQNCQKQTKLSPFSISYGSPDNMYLIDYNIFLDLSAKPGTASAVILAASQ
jgi:hypothetical protein